MHKQSVEGNPNAGYSLSLGSEIMGNGHFLPCIFLGFQSSFQFNMCYIFKQKEVTILK